MNARKPAPLRLSRLLDALTKHRVRFIVTGSVAALIHGLSLEPGDLDITPDLEPANLERLGHLLKSIAAKPKFVPGWKRGLDREACALWVPEPPTEQQLDHRFVTDYGELDIVPRASGTYEDLLPRSLEASASGLRFRVAHPDDVVEFWNLWGRPKDQSRIASLLALRATRLKCEIPPGLEGRLGTAGEEMV